MLSIELQMLLRNISCWLSLTRVGSKTFNRGVRR